MSQSVVAVYHPLFVPKKVGLDIWIVDGDTVDMSFKLFTVPFSTRMTIVRLDNRDLWLHSPIRLTDELKREIDKLGTVKHLVAPNKLHYVFIEEWSKAYPQASVWAASGLEKQFTRAVGITEFTILEKTSSPNWSKEINYFPFQGSAYIEEVVFFHQQSKTLILTDLIENIELCQPTFFQQLLFRFGANTAPNGCTPRDLRLTFINRKLAKQSYLQLTAWQPKNIILSHGTCFFGNAPEQLKRAFKWLS